MRALPIESVRKLSGRRWELWEARARLETARCALDRARSERLLLERRLTGASSPRAEIQPEPVEACGRALAAPDTEMAIVVLCPEHGEALDRTLLRLQPAGRAAGRVVIAAARATLGTEQTLRRLEREGLAVHRSGDSLGAAANAAVRGTSAPYVLALRAGGRTRLDRCSELVGGGGRFDVVALTGAGGTAQTVRPAGAAELLLAGLAPAASLVSRPVFESAGGFDEALQSGLDLDLWLRAGARGARVAVMNGALEPPEAGASFFAGQAWAADLDRIVTRHAGWLARDAGTPAALERADAELVRQLEETQRDCSEVEAQLEQERRELHRLSERLRRAGKPRLDLGELPRADPLSAHWGMERGQAIDRRYIETFLRSHEAEVRGRCLEIKEPAYTKWFGGTRVTAWDVLDIDPANAGATLHGDLTRGAGIPDAQYDCFILTQTLHLLYDFRGALSHALRVLKPGGTLLLTVPAVSRVPPEEGGLDTDYWRFTAASLRRLLAELLPLEAFEVTSYGNVLAAAGFLYGLAVEDLEPGELDRLDPHFPVIIAARARKPA